LQRNSPTGALGSADLVQYLGGADGSAEAGAEFWRAIGRDLGEFLRPVADYDPDAP